MKEKIKLNENKLQSLVSECIAEVLKENNWKGWDELEDRKRMRKLTGRFEDQEANEKRIAELEKEKQEREKKKDWSKPTNKAEVYMGESKKPVRINESQLQSLIKESTLRILKESEMDEGFWDNMKAGWQGAKAGFNAQKSLDSDYANLKQEHDYDDTLKTMNNPMKKMDKTAAESSEDLLKQAQYYQRLANQLRARANAIDKKYALQKTGVNQRAATVKPQQANMPDVNTMKQPMMNPVTKNRPNPNKNLNPLSL